jgi:CheY-like chemotaxis protein
LALARSMTELHGGTLTFEAVTPHGSRFIMRLPRATGAPSPAAGGDGLQARPATARRVLLVEDNDDGRMMMQAALEAAGHVVQSAADGLSGVAAAAAFAPDVAVLDIGLPGMNGYELARTLRRRYPDLRLIALTGYGQDADAQAAGEAGFDAHCTKPITIDELLNEIEAAVEASDRVM